MSENLRYYNQCCEVPQEAIKPITGGRLNGKSDINAMWRIKKLTEMFGPCGIGWYTVIKNKWLEPGADGEIAAFVDIDLYYKEGGEWSMPIPGTGGNRFVAKESSKMYTDDDCYKKAYTDAISVAAKAIGVGGNVHWERDPSKYDKNPNNPPKSNPQGKPDTKPTNGKDRPDDFIAGLEADKRQQNIAHVCKEIQELRKSFKMPEKQFLEVFKQKYEVDYYDADIEKLKQCHADMKKGAVA